jgi:HEAT repeat protein
LIDERAVGPVSEAVAGLLKHEDPYVQYLAAGILRRMGPDGRPQAAALAEAMGSNHAQVCHEAAAALGAIGPAAAEAGPALRTALLDALRDQRGAACGLITTTLAEIDPEGIRHIVPRIAALLRHEDADLRYLAARTLGQTGVAGVPALVAVIGSDDARVAECARQSLAGMGADAARALADVLAEGDAPARLAATKILAEIGAEASVATDALIRALRATDSRLVNSAAHALGAIGPAAARAIGPLTAAAKADRKLAKTVRAAIRRIQPSTK